MRRFRRAIRCGLCLAPLVGAVLPAAGAAQDGAGTAGAIILQMPAGSRAPALSGAYTAISGDADVLFHNPAGAAALRTAGSLAYQRHVEDIGLISAAGAVRADRIVIGASLLMLDYGDIEEIVPDDDFGGQTGRPTGNTVSASELAARLSASTALMGERLHLGIAAGLVSADLAGASRSAPFLDAGVQYLFPALTIGASLRNLGGGLSGAGLPDAPLPTELRAGASFNVRSISGLGAVLAADFVAGIEEGTSGVAAGVEAGLLPDTSAGLGAVARVGYDTGAGDDGLGALRIGGGVSMSGLAVDYTWQRYDFFGTIHRFGIRWSRLP